MTQLAARPALAVALVLPLLHGGCAVSRSERAEDHTASLSDRRSGDDVFDELYRQSVEGKEPRPGFFEGWTVRFEVEGEWLRLGGRVRGTHWRLALDVITRMIRCQVGEVPEERLLVVSRVSPEAEGEAGR